MRLRALCLVVMSAGSLLGACGGPEAKEPSQASLSFADAPVTPKSSPRAVHSERFSDAVLEASADADACSAYAECIDEGSRSGADGGMHASSSTIRSWERSTGQLRECATAHALARAGGLCH
ncbi:MAG: hypothetical protein JWP87_3354 [Labilithrix sp.]|nr:hypothetical protein [Labilithrix sp.]